MATVDEHDGPPPFRFKRRKLVHARRTAVADDTQPGEPGEPAPRHATATGPADAQDVAAGAPSQACADEDEDEASVANLTAILRKRRRPQDRVRGAARKAAATKAEGLVQLEAPTADQYAGRFVIQTGQVVDKDDSQMTEFVEARLAELNLRKYGWPIPRHLESAVAAVTSPGTETLADAAQRHRERAEPYHHNLLATGIGKLQEIDLGPEASANNARRTHEARRRIEGVPVDSPGAGARDQKFNGKLGRRRRSPKRRNSEDLRRDMMVEAVLREAKLDYFEDDRPASPLPKDDGDVDDVLYELFRRDYESQESRNQRKPALPPGPKGVKEQPKGPKLGGSRSARAAMRLQEEQAARSKR